MVGKLFYIRIFILINLEEGGKQKFAKISENKRFEIFALILTYQC